MLELADRHMQLGYRKLHRMLRNEGFQVNAKLIWRIARKRAWSFAGPCGRGFRREAANAPCARSRATKDGLWISRRIP